jgi:hypothetical protein
LVRELEAGKVKTVPFKTGGSWIHLGPESS